MAWLVASIREHCTSRSFRKIQSSGMGKAAQKARLLIPPEVNATSTTKSGRCLFSRRQ
jgi:hypothetical protein